MGSEFLIGASTAAYQVEGNNSHSDYWTIERLPHTSFTEISGMAADHYSRYEEDIKLMKDAGMNAYRFSIEWARIEPEKGCFSKVETEHYRKVLSCCHSNGIRPIVTLHHFSSPKWLIEEGGWENELVIGYFQDYCRYIAEQMGDLMEYVCTINEANMRLQMSAIVRMMAKSMGINLQIGVKMALPEELMLGQKEECEAFGNIDSVNTFLTACTPEGDEIIMKTHMAAKEALKGKCPHLKVGLTLSLHDVQVCEGGGEYAAKLWDEEFSHYLPYIKDDDFIGVQNYTRTLAGKDCELPVPENAKVTQMGYEFYPQALGNVVRRVWNESGLPILVTEHGVATQDDSERIEFIDSALQDIEKIVDDGIPVMGYLHWSLFDNFEWQQGYSKTFGLIAVDRQTQERMPKKSLFELCKIWDRIRRAE